VIVGDDPKLITRSSAVAPKDLKAAFQAELVFLSPAAPLAANMAREEILRSLA